MTKWVSVFGYPLYEVSDQGDVRDKREHAPVKLSYSESKKGGWGSFVQVSLKDEQGKGKSERLARLVLMSFTPMNPPELMGLYFALHKNDVKTDNRLENLYWGTAKQNQADRKRNQTAREQGVAPQEITDLNPTPWQNRCFENFERALNEQYAGTERDP